MSAMNQHLLVRYLVKKDNSSIVEALFIDDDTTWPPEGLFPLRDDETPSFSNVVNPDQYPKHADLVYDNGAGRSWWALVHPKQSPAGLLNLRTDWKPLNKEEDWNSLMKWLNEYR
jgi:hypothetical protein